MWDDESGPYLDEMMLWLPSNIVATGDLVMAGQDGRLLECPEGFNDSADKTKSTPSLSVFADRLPQAATTLLALASHGRDIVGTLPVRLRQRQQELASLPDFVALGKQARDGFGPPTPRRPELRILASRMHLARARAAIARHENAHPIRSRRRRRINPSSGTGFS